MTRLKKCEHRISGEYCIDALKESSPESLCDRCAAYFPNAKCYCGRPATIWIRPPGVTEDTFLCDTHAFHLARIIMQDLGHARVEGN